MALLISEFRVFFPEFSNATSYPDALVDARLQTALRIISAAYFGARASDAQAYLAAHLLAIGPAAGVVGPGAAMSPVEVQDGSTRIRFAESSSAGLYGSLSRTSYGQIYERMVKLGGGPMVVL